MLLLRLETFQVADFHEMRVPTRLAEPWRRPSKDPGAVSRIRRGLETIPDSTVGARRYVA